MQLRTKRDYLRLQKACIALDTAYRLGMPRVTDAQFDRYVAQLRAWEQLHPADAVPDSVTRHIGVEPPPAGAARPAHMEPMGSVDHSYDLPAVLDWIGSASAPVRVEPKIDGIALALRYDSSGYLACAATRGDGTHGIDVTEKIRLAQGIPSMLPGGSACEIRGELFMTFSDLAMLNAAGSNYKTPRNAVAAAMQLSPWRATSFPLRFLAHSCAGFMPDFPDGLAVPHVLACAGDLTTLSSTMDALMATVPDIPCDGVIFKRAGGFPLAPSNVPAMAYKFTDCTAIAEIARIFRTPRGTVMADLVPLTMDNMRITKIALRGVPADVLSTLRHGSALELTKRGGTPPVISRIIAI